jgi:hypothetical protein
MHIQRNEYTARESCVRETPEQQDSREVTAMFPWKLLETCSQQDQPAASEVCNHPFVKLTNLRLVGPALEVKKSTSMVAEPYERTELNV